MLAAGRSVRREVLEDKGAIESADTWPEDPPSSTEARESARAHFEEILAFIDESAAGVLFSSFERGLFGRVLRLGRLLVALFMTVATERTAVPRTEQRGRRCFRRHPAKRRVLGTLFGRVPYWRLYMFQVNGGGGGYFPLDLRLGLSADGFSAGVLSLVAQLATKVSFTATAVLIARFLGWSPSTKTIEQTVLGLGRHTQAFFEQLEAPEDDGEVLVIQVDSKATPTATERELKLRRGKRSRRPPAASPRHRGRERRAGRPPKERRKNGEHSKNGRATTLLVMYTLKVSRDADGQVVLLGPLNRRIYASYAPKRHAFAVARREADKRGFSANSGKVVHILTDGDTDLATYTKEYFPAALHTLDVIHVVEKLWEAGACFLRDGSDKLRAWMVVQKRHLYAGRIGKLLTELRAREDGLKPTPRKRLQEIISFLEKREHMMSYGDLIDRDLDISTGIAEGAIRFVVSQRFDDGGMRWIRERAEPLLQLRCIEVNGDWDRFIEFVESRTTNRQERSLRPVRLLRKRPIPLPVLEVTPC